MELGVTGMIMRRPDIQERISDLEKSKEQIEEDEALVEQALGIHGRFEYANGGRILPFFCCAEM